MTGVIRSEERSHLLNGIISAAGDKVALITVVPMIADITVRERNDFTEVKRGPLMG